MGPLGVEHVARKASSARRAARRGGAARRRAAVPKENSASDPGIVTAQDVEAMITRHGHRADRHRDCVFLHTATRCVAPRDWDKFDAAEKAKRVAQFNAVTWLRPLRLRVPPERK